MTETIDLTTRIGALMLKNPAMTASGTSGCGEELSEFMDIASLGAFVAKGVTLNVRKGNPPGRVVETASGMLNAIGLQNNGLEEFLEKKIPLFEKINTTIIANVAGNTPDEYIQVAEALCGTGAVDAIELNLSCPNVKAGGIAFGKCASTLFEVVKAVREHCPLPLWVKLTPNVTDIGELARSAEEAGADAIVAVNTFVGMAVDIATGQPALANRVGGLSGAAIKPLALYAVDQVVKACDLPVIAVGGITTGADALEFHALGAAAFQVGTAMLVDPCRPLKILDEMRAILSEKGLSSLSEWIGVAR